LGGAKPGQLAAAERSPGGGKMGERKEFFALKRGGKPGETLDEEVTCGDAGAHPDCGARSKTSKERWERWVEAGTQGCDKKSVS